MSGIVQILYNSFKSFLDQGDPRVKDWPLMQTPFPGMAMIAAYIYFVKVAGPQLMGKRRPFDLRKPMLAYNFLLVFVSLVVFLGFGWYGFSDGYSHKCRPVDYSNRIEAVRLAQISYLFYLTKFVEFTDTIFFVLRKKDNQISTLHVLHHSIVPFSVWFGVKFAPGGYNIMFPFLNSFVHGIMYTYYGVAALGEKYKKYLFWKRHMTYIQLAQFVTVIVYIVFLYINKCNVSTIFILMHFGIALLFLAFFLNFFVNSYVRKPTERSKSVLVSTKKDCKVKMADDVTNGNGFAKQTISEVSRYRRNIQRCSDKEICRCMSDTICKNGF